MIQPVAHDPETSQPGVLLVVPPFHGLKCAALGPSQLCANLRAAGIPCEVLYLNLRFAERIGPHVSEWLSGTGPYLCGELLFSHVVHERPDTRAAVQAYVDEVLAGTDMEQGLLQWFPGQTAVDALLSLIDEARDFIANEGTAEVLAREPWMIGLSSTFQANCCSLAVIQAVKAARPDVVTVMGGANCEGDMGMELLAKYDAIDYVGRGECDQTFVEMVRTLQEHGKAKDVHGFLSREDTKPSCPSGPLHGPELDANPYPYLDDYFHQLETCSFKDQIEPGLVMETSRGCWWGEKHHCTFCAFNRDGMVFRSKGADRTKDEMAALVDRHGVARMEITDNILDMAYFKTLLKDLADQPIADMFWETKANLTREQVELMADAKIRWIQPGIESLSDLTLQLMRKGSTGLQNIQLLKWGTEVGMYVSWNWLLGFPGEDEGEVEKLADLVRSIHHLQPPSSAPVIYLERYSPYFMTPEEWGLEPIRPAQAYFHVYPFDPDSVFRLAFFFECDFFTAKQGTAAYARMRDIVQVWKDNYERSHLMAFPRKKSLLLVDTRLHAKRLFHRLTGLRRKVYEYIDRQHGDDDIARQFKDEASPEEIAAILKSFVDDRIAIRNDTRILAVAAQMTPSYREFVKVFPGGQLVGSQDESHGTAPDGDPSALRVPPSEAIRGMKRKLRSTVVRRVVAALSPADAPTPSV